MMSRHLTDERLMEVLGDAADAAARTHVESCPDCAARLREAGDGLALAREVEVPEPAPQYWEAFRRNVGRRIEDEGAARRWRWFLVPILATAVSLALVVPAVHRRVTTSPAHNPVLAAWSALPPAEQDDGLEVLEGLALADADLPVVDGERGTIQALADLSDDEVHAVGEALRHDVPGAVL